MRRIFTVSAAALALACQDTPLSPDRAEPQAAIVDGRHGLGNTRFFFLPPLVPDPLATGAFDASLSPSVEICELSGDACGVAVASFTMTGGAGSEVVRVDPLAEHYVVNWHTDRFALDPARMYRIRVLVSGAELGSADVDVVATGRELRNVRTGENVGLVDGRTLPVKFRIEAGAVTVIGSDGGIASFSDGRVRMTFPAGALGSESGITAVPATDPTGDPLVVPGTVFRFEPDGLTFEEPVDLTMAFDPARVPAGVEEDSLAVHVLRNGTWVLVDGSSSDGSANTATAAIDGFSIYALRRRIPCYLISFPFPTPCWPNRLPPRSVTVHPPAESVDVGEAVRFLAVARDRLGRVVWQRVAFDWHSSDSTVAQVDGTGFATGRRPGWIAVMATLSGTSLTGTALLTVLDQDEDGDGVLDGADRCPGTPPATPVDANGCPIVTDEDGDGVPDAQDACPNTPLGTAVDHHGCPPDDDGDGVPNSNDQCPGTPAGAVVDVNGCPVLPPPSSDPHVPPACWGSSDPDCASSDPVVRIEIVGPITGIKVDDVAGYGVLAYDARDYYAQVDGSLVRWSVQAQSGMGCGSGCMVVVLRDLVGRQTNVVGNIAGTATIAADYLGLQATATLDVAEVIFRGSVSTRWLSSSGNWIQASCRAYEWHLNTAPFTNYYADGFAAQPAPTTNCYNETTGNPSSAMLLGTVRTYPQDTAIKLALSACVSVMANVAQSLISGSCSNPQASLNQTYDFFLSRVQ